MTIMETDEIREATRTWPFALFFSRAFSPGGGQWLVEPFGGDFQA
jgi:hypothetical protein